MYPFLIHIFNPHLIHDLIPLVIPIPGIPENQAQSHAHMHLTLYQKRMFTTELHSYTQMHICHTLAHMYLSSLKHLCCKTSQIFILDQ